MPKKLTAIDVYFRLSQRSGWSVDRVRLSDANVAELASIIEPSLGEEERKSFGVAAQNIFALAVDRLLTQARHSGAPVVALRDALERFSNEMERAQAAVDALDADLRRLLDASLTEMATAQRVLRTSPRTSIDLWREETSDLLGIIIAACRGSQIAPVKGDSRAVFRQMTRGLLALVFELTGEPPRRSTRRTLVGAAESSVDDYWFLHFVQRLADFAVARSVELAPPTQNDRLPERQPKGGDHAAQPAPAEELRARSAPPLTAIVREELEAFHAKLAGKSRHPPAGEIQRRNPG
jgi:hypothetical protein